jgi:hypothetical protein
VRVLAGDACDLDQADVEVLTAPALHAVEREEVLPYLEGLTRFG